LRHQSRPPDTAGCSDYQDPASGNAGAKTRELIGRNCRCACAKFAHAIQGFKDAKSYRLRTRNLTRMLPLSLPFYCVSVRREIFFRQQI
jgi:hypothetical protein